MYLINYHLYANKASLPQIMAEDTAAAELRNPVFYIRTEYRYSRMQRAKERLSKRWADFWSTPARAEMCR